MGAVQNRGFGVHVIAGKGDVNVYRRMLYKLYIKEVLASLVKDTGNFLQNVH